MIIGFGNPYDLSSGPMAEILRRKRLEIQFEQEEIARHKERQKLGMTKRISAYDSRALYLMRKNHEMRKRAYVDARMK